MSGKWFQIEWSVPLLALVLVIVVFTSCRSNGMGGRRSSGIQPKSVDDVQVDRSGQITRPGDYRQDIRVDGADRYYLVHTPPSYDGKTAMPVVLAFHGGGGNPEAFVTMTGFNDLADRQGFIVVYPAGSGATARRLSWNILLSETYATSKNVDDIGYVKALLNSVEKYFKVDTKRIYAAGFSQGGMLCYRLACDAELSQRLAAIAPVGATMTVDPDDCNASRAVPVISFHGTADPFSNYEGGVGSKSPRNDRVARPSVAQSIRYWVRRDKLGEQPSATRTVGQARKQAFGPENKPNVVLWTLEEGGHTWPGGKSPLPEWVMGKVNRDIDASSLIWDFFKERSL